ncbi:MAG: hypothetical protein P0Y60_17060 [Candidatus Microbacterium colombiense]|nr:MAG: hypothetical protein P0Y60_17060 [Microbacterium sp.]
MAENAGREIRILVVEVEAGEELLQQRTRVPQVAAVALQPREVVVADQVVGVDQRLEHLRRIGDAPRGLQGRAVGIAGLTIAGLAPRAFEIAEVGHRALRSRRRRCGRGCRTGAR